MIPALEVHGLSVRYGRRVALAPTDLSAPRGQLMALVGPNGAGKSTLLKAVARLIRPTTGHVRVAGYNVARLTPRARARLMAFLPQDVQTPQMTVAETLLLGRRPHFGPWGLTEGDEAVVNQVIERLDLAPHLSATIDRLSGGERQRVLLARALIQAPQVLLLDEPINHLDPRHQLEVLELIRSAAHDQNLLAVVVLHDINQALRLADRVLMLAGGRVQADRQAADVDAATLTDLYGVCAEVREFGSQRHVVFQKAPGGVDVQSAGAGSQLPHVDPRVVPIGRIRSPFRTRSEAPHQSVFAGTENGAFCIEVDSAFAAGLDRLDAFRYAYVLYWLDRPVATAELTVVPPWGEQQRIGVFASRSPRRPNPIGLSVVRVIEVKGGRVWVDGLDALDGTPVVDIKPYIPPLDVRTDATIGWLDNPAGRAHLGLPV